MRKRLKIRNTKASGTKQLLGGLYGARKRTVNIEILGDSEVLEPLNPADNGGGTWYERHSPAYVGGISQSAFGGLVVETCVFCGKELACTVIGTLRALAAALPGILPELGPQLTPEQLVQLDTALSQVQR